MTKEFNNFIRVIRNGIENGEITLIHKGKSVELTDFDLAVQFAIGKIGEKKGYPFHVTAEEIETKIKEFAPEVLESEG